MGWRILPYTSPRQLNSRAGGLSINILLSLGTNRAAVGCSGNGAGRAGRPHHTHHGCPGNPAGLAQPWEGTERESVSCPAGGTLSASAPPREGPLTMCWPRVMDRRVHDSLFLVTHGFAGLRQCHGKYFFNNSKGGGEWETERKTPPHSSLKLVNFPNCF